MFNCDAHARPYGDELTNDGRSDLKTVNPRLIRAYDVILGIV